MAMAAAASQLREARAVIKKQLAPVSAVSVAVRSLLSTEETRRRVIVASRESFVNYVFIVCFVYNNNNSAMYIYCSRAVQCVHHPEPSEPELNWLVHEQLVAFII